MAKTVATILGIGFLLVGVAGFVAPGLLGAHLSLAHNIIHLVSGAVALYLGLAGTLAAARLFGLVFGIVYLGLGAVGFVLGSPGTPTLHDVTGPAALTADSRLFKVIPGMLELGTSDHLIHIVLGAIFIAGALLTRVQTRDAGDRAPL